ncbi:hypothetical protein HPB51_008004 [Rhipicephalus microplus]|uniref:Tick transposon n=1 Tax=Rhipicephalus microplus TaxID=6941 RepID=A0A9J6DFG8_RHIMP|nr:hypothetical protein HPB51_008004 [Rhipicephalus microplus]
MGTIKKSTLEIYRTFKQEIAKERIYDNTRGSSLLFEARTGVLRTKTYRAKYEGVDTVCSSPPGSYDERCGPVFNSYRRFGAKHLSKMSTGAKEAIMKCRNITESAALQRDAEFEQRRRLCIGLFFPTVPEENLEEHLCRFTRMDDIDDVQKLRNDDRQVLELRASRIECMQKFFDDAPRGIRDRKYANLGEESARAR